MMDKLKRHNRFKLAIQMLCAALFNGYAVGFAKGQIFSGNSKVLCVPVLNCYSCPGALGSCPIGALQAVMGSHKFSVSFYVLGFMMLFGVVLGRLICGFMCPFGLVQDLLHRIPSPKLKVPKKIDKPLRYVKYLMLIFPVLLLPVFLTNAFGMAPPYFCKLICPAGILQGAFPLMALNESLREAAGLLFQWKVLILFIVVVLSIVMARPFCKYVCPLGAFYGLFNRFSFYQLHLDHSRCTSCRTCERNCPMDVEILKNINSAECIRCGTCKSVCPESVIDIKSLRKRQVEAQNI